MLTLNRPKYFSINRIYYFADYFIAGVLVISNRVKYVRFYNKCFYYGQHNLTNDYRYLRRSSKNIKILYILAFLCTRCLLRLEH